MPYYILHTDNILNNTYYSWIYWDYVFLHCTPENDQIETSWGQTESVHCKEHKKPTGNSIYSAGQLIN